MPSSPEENYQIISIINVMEDLLLKVADAMAPFSVYDEEKKKGLCADLESKFIPLLLGDIEKRLKEKPNKDFLVGDELTIADFYVMGLWTHLTTVTVPAKAMLDKFQGAPLLKAYLQKRLAAIGPITQQKVKLYDMENITYKGEVIRTLLRHAKIPYEDVKIKQEDWPAKKNSFPLKQLPVVECHGRQNVQTNAIMHALSMKYGYLPLEPLKYASVLEICGIVDDFAGGFALANMPNLPEEVKKAKLVEYTTKRMPIILQALEKRLKANKNQDFFCGKKHSNADFYMIAACRTVINIQGQKNYEDYFKNFGILKKYVDKQLATSS
jgi:glutathione S-transferase